MISYEGEIIKVPLTEESFERKEITKSHALRRRTWLYKRNNLYYLFGRWSSPRAHWVLHRQPPEGPWKYGG